MHFDHPHTLQNYAHASIIPYQSDPAEYLKATVKSGPPQVMHTDLHTYPRQQLMMQTLVFR